MPVTLQEIIFSLGKKLDVLEQRYVEAMAENADLKADLIEAKKEIKSLRQDKEYLIVSHKLASEPDEIIRCRRRFAGLIGDIEKCISQLKE